MNFPVQVRILSCLFCLGLAASLASVTEHIELSSTGEISRAELYLWKPEIQNIKGILLYCPGLNGNGKGFVNNPVWQDFATLVVNEMPISQNLSRHLTLSG